MMKILKQLLLLNIILIFGNFFAQKQNNHWRYGATGAIDFNTMPPSFVSGCPISTSEGSASVSDRLTGELLFYTDGVTVWNANDQVMPNGTGLLGGAPNLLSSTTAAVIVPKPGSNNLFYIITIDEQGSSNGITYSVIDMTLNGGLGDIIVGQKNIFLFQTGSEKLEVVPASDGLSLWLISHDTGGNSFFSFKIDNNGIQSSPVISQIGGTQGNGAGHMKVNKQFNKIAIGLLNLGSGSSTQIELFDFDNNTGIISNAIIWNYTIQVSLIYGVEFSPNGKVLYVSDLQNLVQYDITKTTPVDIQNSAYQVATSNSTSLQLGIDDKIYVNGGSLNAINCPNKLGAACGYQTNVIANQTGGGGYGLPKWVYYADDSPKIIFNTIIFNENCFGAATQFFIADTSGISNITWNFGDPNSGVNNTAVGYNVYHTFSQLDIFNIQAIITTACGFDTLFTDVAILNPCNLISITSFNVIGDTCNANTNFSFQPVGTINANQLTWTFGDPGSGINSFISYPSNPNAFHTFSSEGIYNVCLTYQIPGSPITNICKTIRIGQCCNGIIYSKGSCIENSIPFSIISNATISSIIWDFGDPSSGANNISTSLTPSHIFNATGSYNIRSIINFSCGVDTIFKTLSITNCDSIIEECQLFVPNVFTPNNDGINDKFQLSTICESEYFECLIFNRWGGIIFNTSNLIEKWDGKYKGFECSDGVYVYMITYKFPMQPKKNISGIITLLR
jgi:gliding motility-associated-like protein